MPDHERDACRRLLRRSLLLAGLILLAVSLAAAQDLPAVAGWTLAQPTPGTHRLGLALSAPHGGKACAVIVGTTAADKARGAFLQEFYGQTALPAGRTYRYSLTYRTEGVADGGAAAIVDCYTAAGEASHRGLVGLNLQATDTWRTEVGTFTVPADVVRTRLLLYLHGVGRVWYDDVSAAAEDAPDTNLLRNGGFEPPASYIYEVAPERDGGPVRFSADFDNGVLGTVKALGPDEFYVQAFPANRPRSPYPWFHFKLEGCAGRTVTIHLSPAPYFRKTDWGYDAAAPVMSTDGDTWTGIADKSWNEDGSVLTFRQRFTQSPTWVAYFYPLTTDHITRFIAAQAQSPYFTARTIGLSKAGRPLRMYTITDPTVPANTKRFVLLTTLQHDLETTGAWALEGLTRFLLSEDPRAAALRRGFAFHVLPRLNEDGIAEGNLYSPGISNMNRQWGLDTMPELQQVQKLVLDWAAAGHKLDLFMDFHGWCTPERTTLFMTFGKELGSETDETEAVRLTNAIRPRLTGKIGTTVWRHREEYVSYGVTDLRRLAPGWMKLEAGTRLAYSIEIFGEPDCTQEGYLRWGQAFAEGMAEFYGCGP